MKKILILLMTIPLFFGSCEKEEEENNNNTNNNSSLTLEQTRWNVSSILYSEPDTSFTITLPWTDFGFFEGGLVEIEWTFFDNNGVFLEKVVDGYGVIEYDTLVYTHYENLNNISFSNPNSSYVSLIREIEITPGIIQIVDFTSNTLSVELVDDEESYIVYLNKSN